MENVLKGLLILLGCVTLGFLGLFLGFNWFYDPAEEQVESIPPIVQEQAHAALAPAWTPPVTIKPTTKMIYEYPNAPNGTVETSEAYAPDFLLGKDEESLKGLFPGWEVTRFSAEEVVMRRTTEDQAVQRYIIGVMDGYVSVFYQQPDHGTTLKEVTDTLVSALHEDEQQRLIEGVTVVGEEELIRILQDYGS